MEDHTAAAAAILEKPVVSNSNGAGVNPRRRKRGIRETAAPPAATVVSTGLRLAIEEEIKHPLSDNIAAQIENQREEIDLLLKSQGEELRRAMAERRRRHYVELLEAAEAALERRLRELAAAADLAAQRGAELERRLAGLRAESVAWRSKAVADHAAAASLHAQLRRQAADQQNELLPAAADDSESAHVDPRRVDLLPEGRTCRRCSGAGGVSTVVALPCRHLSLCSGCAAAAECCPICRCPHTGTVQVFLC